MPADFPGCDMTTDLTDAEIAQIVRGAAAIDGVTPQFEAIAVTAECRLANRHEGDCASWQASLIDLSGTAWLRWGEARRIDWIADCKGSCVLFFGHPGVCNHAGQLERTPDAR